MKLRVTSIYEGGTIPNSIVLSAQESAQLTIVGRGKTLEFNDVPGAFLILDGQHRVYGFSMAKTSLRVPVVIYNGLTRAEETRLFIDINTKQKPVPSQLLLDIKRLAEIETESESILRDVFDLFDNDGKSALFGYLSASESAKGKITRVTFNQAVGPILHVFAGREPSEIYEILNAYFSALKIEIVKKTSDAVLSKPVVFRAFIGIFRAVAQRVSDRHDENFSSENFHEVVHPIFQNMQIKRLEKPGTSPTVLRDYLDERMKSKFTL